MPVFKKLGRIFYLEPVAHRSTTHAQVPTILVMSDRVRVYFAARNPEGKSYPAYVDLDRKNLTHILEVHEEPLLSFGQPGTFDDDGLMPSCVLEQPDGIWMYYTAWNRRTGVPYHNSTGLAVSIDGGRRFVRKFEGPILDRTPEEPYLAVTPFVLQEDGIWKMWYVSGVGWEKVEGKYESIYVIKYATSKDGIRWHRPNLTCVAQNHSFEAFSNPTVMKHEGLYHMWYCFRDSKDFRDGKGSYRIGYAKSGDGMNWQRLDAQAGLSLSDSGWDSTMQCYPYVLNVDGITYMFFNGNSFGQSGIGLAVLESW